jgi:hypothetical protein
MSRITESARGEECQVRVIGICNFDPATTVWSHANGLAAGKGIGMKSLDLLGTYACFRCHALIDRALPLPDGMTRADVKLAFWEGHARSVQLLEKKGLL